MIDNELKRWAHKRGLRNHSLYRRYHGIRQRCLNPNYVGYKHWGGKGIKICKRWMIFENFLEDMYGGYLAHTKKHGKFNTFLDRIDGNKDYTPNNCRWVTRIRQNSNTNRNVFISFRGKKLTMSEWARRIGVDRSTILYRVFEAKWPLTRALTK